MYKKIKRKNADMSSENRVRNPDHQKLEVF